MVLELCIGSAATLSMGKLYLMYREAKSELDRTLPLYYNILEQATQANKEKAVIETEHNYLKLNIQSLMERPVCAVLTAEQVNQICQTVSQLVIAASTPKEKAN